MLHDVKSAEDHFPSGVGDVGMSGVKMALLFDHRSPQEIRNNLYWFVLLLAYEMILSPNVSACILGKVGGRPNIKGAL